MRVRIITQTLHRPLASPRDDEPSAERLLRRTAALAQGLRYLVPVFLFLLLVSSAALAPRSLFYALAFLRTGRLLRGGRRLVAFGARGPSRTGRLALPQYFVLANLASLLAFYKFLRGERYARWEPIRGAEAEGGGQRRQMNQAVETEIVPAGTANRFFRTDHLKADLAGRTARSASVMVAAQGMKFVINMASAVILARLLSPQDYGLVAMVAILTNFVYLFKDLGLSAATMQKPEINHRQVSTLFWVNIDFSVGDHAADGRACAPLSPPFSASRGSSG